MIATLDTGSGKTFIAVLLIRWVASQPSVAKGKKVRKAPVMNHVYKDIDAAVDLLLSPQSGSCGTATEFQ